MLDRPPVLIRRIAVLASLAASFAAGPSNAQSGPVPGDEKAIQAYLALWSHNSAINDVAVDRFYAPTVIYYGKRLTRSQVLADKLRYIKAWPVRHYSEVPGTIEAHCNEDRSRCRVSVIMAWRRVARDARVSVGRARIAFDFVPADGGRKIARESARDL